MKNICFCIRSLSFAAFIAIGFISCSQQPFCADYRVIPLPENITIDDSRSYSLNEQTHILYTPDDSTAVQTACFLASYIQRSTGLIIQVGEISPSVDTSKGICLEVCDTIRGAESYRIHIEAARIRIIAHGGEGLFRGVQTLCKSFPSQITEGKSVQFPAGEVADQPRFSYRGIMLDVARSFYPVEFIKKTIDMLALHNLNRLHLHLTDDQGWRIEIKKHPLLTEVGAFRADSTLGSHGGFYTQQEIRDIVKYAQERFVTIIPEIDMPGHIEAALTAYPALGCTGGPYAISSHPGVRRDILCMGNPQTLQFAKDVLTEVIELFPSEYIHIGGDEVPTTRWEACEKCQHTIRKHNLKDCEGHTAEQLLQGQFNAEIEAFLHTHGRKLVGWDEILEGKVSPQSTIMVWRGVNKGIEALRKGHNVIMTPNNKFYLNYYQSVNIETEPQASGWFINAETVYKAETWSLELTSTEQARILGVQGSLWGAWIPKTTDAEYMLLPRASALAEMAWCAPERLDFDDFLHRMPHMQVLYKQTGWIFSPHLFDITAEFRPNATNDQLLVSLSSGANADIRYTLDGTQPNAESTRYEQPLCVNSNTSLRAVAFTPDGLASDLYYKEICFNKATLKSAALLTQPAARYAENKLTDGVRGNTIYARGGWTGFQGEDMIAVIDLGQATTISKAGISTLIDYGSHIMDVATLEVAVSEYGESFQTVARQDYPAKEFSLQKEQTEHDLEFKPIQTRFVRITAKRAERLPAQLTTAQGAQPFLFIDEINIH